MPKKTFEERAEEICEELNQYNLEVNGHITEPEEIEIIVKALKSVEEETRKEEREKGVEVLNKVMDVYKCEHTDYKHRDCYKCQRTYGLIIARENIIFRGKSLTLSPRR